MSQVHHIGQMPEGVGRPPNPASLSAMAGAPRWLQPANPWHTILRLFAPALLVGAIWSHEPFGAGTAWAASAAVIALLLTSPLLFPKTSRPTSWISRAAFGERIWLNRLSVPVPASEHQAAIVLTIVSLCGALVGLWGAFSSNPWLAGSGVAVSLVARLVFFDRMAALYDAMRTAHPLYRFWSVTPDNDNTLDRMTG